MERGVWSQQIHLIGMDIVDCVRREGSLFIDLPMDMVEGIA